VAIDHAAGSERADVLWTDSGLVCIGERFVRTLTVHMVSGWQTREAEVRSRAGRAMPGYSVLVVRGRSGLLDCSQSEPLATLSEKGRGTAYLGARVSPDSWDGSDMFVPGEEGPILVTDRTRRVFENAGIGNVVLRPLAALTITPGQLKLWGGLRT